MGFRAWLLSLSTFSRGICVIAYVSLSFLFISVCFEGCCPSKVVSESLRLMKETLAGTCLPSRAGPASWLSWDTESLLGLGLWGQSCLSWPPSHVGPEGSHGVVVTLLPWRSPQTSLPFPGRGPPSSPHRFSKGPLSPGHPITSSVALGF